ncbi:S-layer homology domain-containing protein [Veillonella sp.]|uniref:S-layer homology domain-containing protein n=1 Tax=Veillonella sp. TaxID=1926307 RepID=UPI0028FECFD6|nr:S-layer homology domain-containing protein [Veillonella sp.]MDU1680899.1 S-layer homology domain-containing protein [Veillonella sp.]MDU1743475.1 S-layer homology domain-containing protein [Veillonella sp.]
MKSKQVALSLAILLALGTGTVLHVEAQGNPTEYSRHFGDENTVTSDHSLAVGFRNTVSGSYSTAIGQSSTASGETSLAIGRSAQATANNTNAIGRSARAEGENATAIGHGSVSSGRNSNAFGSSAKASAEASTAVGNSTKASGISSTATGFNAEASGNFSSAYGNDARAKGNRSVAVGYNAKAEESATAVGNNANAGAANAVALGSGNTITARGGVGIGSSNSVSGIDSGAFGVRNNVAQANTYVLGSNVTSTQENSVLLGNASTDRAATTETQANINGINYSGFAGVGSARNGVTSVGASGKERQVINVASGKVSSDSTDAINGSQLYAVANTVGGILNNHNTLIVNHDNQITRLTKENLRQDADLLRHEDQIQNHDIQLKNQTERMNNQEKRIDNQDKRLDYLDNRVDNHDARIENHSERIESHERRIEYNKTLATEALKEAKKHTSISAGNNVTVSTSTNAAGGTDYKVSVDKVKFGNVSLDNKGLNNGGNKITNVADGEVSATSKDAVNGSQLYQATSGISNGVNLLNSKIGKVGAGAAALAAIHPLDFDPDDKWNFAAGYGNYAGENAMALGAFYRPNEDTMFSVAGSMGNGENMVNAGVSLKLGQKNGVSTSRVALAKEVQDLKAIVKAQNVEIQQMKVSMGMAPQYDKKDVNFPDIPANHWAYEYVKDLADKGLVEGYPDGEFKGDRAMTRYEYAAIIYRALQLGAPIDGKMGRAINEFNPELARLRDLDRTRVDRISGKDNDRHKVERLRVNNKDNKQTNDYRDVYGSHIERNAK